MLKIFNSLNLCNSEINNIDRSTSNAEHCHRITLISRIRKMLKIFNSLNLCNSVINNIDPSISNAKHCHRITLISRIRKMLKIFNSLNLCNSVIKILFLIFNRYSDIMTMRFKQYILFGFIEIILNHFGTHLFNRYLRCPP